MMPQSTPASSMNPRLNNRHKGRHGSTWLLRAELLGGRMLSPRAAMMLLVWSALVWAGGKHCFLGVEGKPLQNDCNYQSQVRDERDCIYGVTRDRCGVLVCQRGPGESCGWFNGGYGVCADGLMCSNCDKCQGCSFRTFSCWDDVRCLN